MTGSVVIPTAAEVATREQTGFPWQGRYTLPLAIGIVLLSGMIASRRFLTTADGRSWDRMARIFVPLVAVAHFFAWGSVLKRYSLGASSGFPFGDYNIKWAPPGGVWTWIVFMGVSSGFFMLWLLWVTSTSRDDGETPPWNPRRRSQVLAQGVGRGQRW
jgi:cyanate permease